MRKAPALFALYGLNAVAQPTSYVVGTWNLEHFRDGARRGFPESSIPARKNSDYQFVAQTIKNLDAKLLVLQEINGRLEQLVDEDGLSFEDNRSPELEKLIGFLGTGYEYVIAV